MKYKDYITVGTVRVLVLKCTGKNLCIICFLNAESEK